MDTTRPAAFATGSARARDQESGKTLRDDRWRIKPVDSDPPEFSACTPPRGFSITRARATREFSTRGTFSSPARAGLFRLALRWIGISPLALWTAL